MKRKFENVIEKLAGRIAGSLVSDPLKYPTNHSELNLEKHTKIFPKNFHPKKLLKGC